MNMAVQVANLCSGLSRMRDAASPRDAVAVMQAMVLLHKTCLPEAYVAGIQQELLQMICQPVPDAARVYVYLAFHGSADRAEYMKVGVARNVKSRMATLATGNPLPRLWTYSAGFGSRSEAMRVERALLDHMGADRVSGEWIKVAGLSCEAARAVTESLTEVASANSTWPVVFVRAGGLR